MNDHIYKFTFEDGSEAFAHYGVKGMKWDKHVMAQDPAYLESLGMAGAAGEYNENLQDDEYKKELEANSKKNQYPKPNTVPAKQEGKSPLSQLKNLIGGAQKAASDAGKAASKAVSDAGRAASDAGKAASKAVGDAKSNFDNYMKYRGNKAVKTGNMYFDSGDYSSRDHYEILRNGRTRSWTEATKRDFNTGKKKDVTDFSKSPSERGISWWGMGKKERHMAHPEWTVRDLLNGAKKAASDAGKAVESARKTASDAADKLTGNTSKPSSGSNRSSISGHFDHKNLKKDFSQHNFNHQFNDHNTWHQYQHQEHLREHDRQRGRTLKDGKYGNDPISRLIERSEKAHANGEAAAARQRLIDRYSHDTVLGKKTRSRR